MLEAELEQLFIEKLQNLKYTYRPDIRNRDALEQNFRAKFNALNRVTLTDSEFARLLDQIITADTFEAAQTLRTRHTLFRDDETPLDYTLVNLKEWCKNDFEVVNQLKLSTRNSHHRYDVVLLMNGLPVVQIELKKGDIVTRKAMQQIVEYKNDPGNGYTQSLMCFLQLFIVSNRSSTSYFANNNAEHFSFNAEERFLPVYQWADPDNNKVTFLDTFAENFLAKCTLAETISRYMVLVASEKQLLMMRPYQIYAAKAIVDCIAQNTGNGYIWHTTGSGKTLTSFKASTLLKDNDDVDKCVFVVDRKDLDRQTREEFNRFQEGSVEENTNTGKLVRRLLSDEKADKVIVTTIQKLGLALTGGSRKEYLERLEPLRDKRMVFIFDECHRSQFGENQQAIKDFFPQAQLFGFTGTPIFDANARYTQIAGGQGSYKTTQSIFGQQLHAYTITNAIGDQNVLRFHIDYYKPEGTEQDSKTGRFIPPKAAVIEKIIQKHDASTAHRRFNALLATASIDDAIEYYRLFREIQAEKAAAAPNYQPLNIACVFSPPAYVSADARQLQEDLPQESFDNAENPEGKKQALERIISDYNAQYGTNHTVSEFDAYYQDVQKRIKDQKWPNKDQPHAKKIDLTIVVDMLLTGFDSKYLNTLYLDKNLQHHGLIQAMSRTNRVLNDTKPYGNILDFRGQQQAVDEALELFSGQNLEQARKIWLAEPAPEVIAKLDKAVTKLANFMDVYDLPFHPAEVANLKGDAAQISFIKLFKEVQRLSTQLEQYTDLTGEQQEKIQAIIPPDDLQAWRGVYLETAQNLKARQDKPDPEPEIENLDFEFVLFASAIIDYDYIMTLLARYSAQTPGKETMTREQLVSLIQSDAKFMDEGQDIAEFIATLEAGKGLSEDTIRAQYEAFKAARESAELAALAQTHGLDADELQTLVNTTLGRMIFDSEALGQLLAPLNLGWKARKQKEEAVMTDLMPLLSRRAGGQDIAGLRAYE